MLEREDAQAGLGIQQFYIGDSHHDWPRHKRSDDRFPYASLASKLVEAPPQLSSKQRRQSSVPVPYLGRGRAAGIDFEATRPVRYGIAERVPEGTQGPTARAVDYVIQPQLRPRP